MKLQLPPLILVACSLPKHGVNLRHDTLRPLNRRRNQSVGPWASLGGSERVVSTPHVKTRQNRGHHPDDFERRRAWGEIVVTRRDGAIVVVQESETLKKETPNESRNC